MDSILAIQLLRRGYVRLLATKWDGSLSGNLSAGLRCQGLCVSNVCSTVGSRIPLAILSMFLSPKTC